MFSIKQIQKFETLKIAIYLKNDNRICEKLKNATYCNKKKYIEVS